MKQRILIIDDEHHILLMIKKMLERAGFEVDLAINGEDGLKQFEQLPVDLVISDIIMPEKEGLETIREMKRLRPELKIIAMSGGGKGSSDNYLKSAKIFGAARILNKPFTQNQMLSVVFDLLGQSSDHTPFNGSDKESDGLNQKYGR